MSSKKVDRLTAMQAELEAMVARLPATEAEPTQPKASGKRSSGVKNRAGIHRLTAMQVHRAKADLCDGGGLYLLFKGGTPYWIFRYTSPSGQRREQGFGAVAQAGLEAAGASLREARDDAAKSRALLKEAIDPLAKKRADREAAKREEAAKKAAIKAQYLTLRRFARSYSDGLVGTFRNQKHEAQWLTSIEGPPEERRTKAQNASRAKLDALLDRPIADIKPLELLNALAPVCKRTPETGKRVFQRVRVLFNAAVIAELREDNPAITIREELEKQTGERQRGTFASLNYRDLPAFVERLRIVEGVSARALEFQLFTASRPGEVLKAEWSEFNFDRREWLIPGERMKTRQQHLVFLNDAALRILEGQRGQSAKFVFPAPRTGEPMAIDSLRMVMRRMGEKKATPHGTARKCFKTGSKELALAPRDVIECALAHKEKAREEAAYDLSEFLAERRRLAHVWGEFVEGRWQIPNNVVEFKPKAA